MKEVKKKKQLKRAIDAGFEDVAKLEAGSENHSRAVNDLVALRESKRKDKELWIKTGTEWASKIVYGVGITLAIAAGYYFEEKGTVTSFTFKKALESIKKPK